jgi:hypothetical protein
MGFRFQAYDQTKYLNLKLIFICTLSSFVYVKTGLLESPKTCKVFCYTEVMDKAQGLLFYLYL